MLVILIGLLLRKNWKYFAKDKQTMERVVALRLELSISMVKLNRKKRTIWKIIQN